MENSSVINNEEAQSQVTNEEIMNSFIEKNRELSKEIDFESFSMKTQRILLKYKMEEFINLVDKLTNEK